MNSPVRRLFRLIALVALVVPIALATLALGPAGGTAAGILPAGVVPAAPAGACDGAATATNAVVRFYLAVDARRFAAAYRCLTPEERVALPYHYFVSGYAHTVVSRLALADAETPNGAPVDHVAIVLYAVDRAGPTLVFTTFQGQWRVTADGRMARALIRVTARRAIASLPGPNVAALFRAAGEQILEHLHADVTGDGRPDDIYVTSGVGCASCHAQQLWVYSGQRLVFQQEVDDAEVRVAHNHAGMEVRTDTPNTPGLDSCCPSERTFEEWRWTTFGFSLQGQRIVHMTYQ